MGSFSFIEGPAEIATRNPASEWDALSFCGPWRKLRPRSRAQNGMHFPVEASSGKCIPVFCEKTGHAFRPPTSGAYVHLGAPARVRLPRHSSRFCATL